MDVAECRSAGVNQEEKKVFETCYLVNHVEFLRRNGGKEGLVIT